MVRHLSITQTIEKAKDCSRDERKWSNTVPKGMPSDVSPQGLHMLFEEVS